MNSANNKLVTVIYGLTDKQAKKLSKSFEKTKKRIANSCKGVFIKRCKKVRKLF